MLIEPQAAQLFLENYIGILTEVHRLSNGNPELDPMEMLATARQVALSNPSMLDTAVQNLEKQGHTVPTEIIRAIKSIQLKNWVYLRDTTTYSVLIALDLSSAYAVLSLTDKLRDIVGDSGVIIQTGVMEYCGCFVCDGIVENPRWLSLDLRRNYIAHLSQIKRDRKFYARK